MQEIKIERPSGSSVNLDIYRFGGMLSCCFSSLLSIQFPEFQHLKYFTSLQPTLKYDLLGSLILWKLLTSRRDLQCPRKQEIDVKCRHSRRMRKWGDILVSAPPCPGDEHKCQYVRQNKDPIHTLDRFSDQVNSARKRTYLNNVYLGETGRNILIFTVFIKNLESFCANRLCYFNLLPGVILIISEKWAMREWIKFLFKSNYNANVKLFYSFLKVIRG